jgi:hypothetical protein
MSNVAPCEIMVITAKAFGLLPLGFRGQFFGNWKAKHRPMPLRARQVAVYLMLRHTQATKTEIAALFGLSPGNASLRAQEQADHIASEIKTDPDLKDLVNEIEDRIDALHEERIDKAAQPKLPIAKAKQAPAKTRVRAPTMKELSHG